VSVCGEWAWWHEDHGYQRFFCGSGNCPRQKCRTLFWSRRVRLISSLIEEHDLTRFFTLTLDRGFIPIKMNPWDYVHGPWSKLRKRLGRRFTNFKFVAVLEHHKNKDYPHIHGFTNVWVRQMLWSTLWNECKGGRVVWVERVKTPELSSYVSKSLEVVKYVGKENLVSGYKEKGKHRTLWRSQKLKVKKDLTQDSKWVIVREKVFNDEGRMTDYFAEKGVWADGQKERSWKDMERTCRAVSS